ncbi:DUF2202 domain-containing protein [Thermococcus sp. M39]|uniref:DUF2202 domain-containing protein n=1 Tax=unclassified Thermococcus TaxID=2627626 RepID=UPI00143AA88C|nr:MULTISPECIES: DUF2202 domain-containing protein [unclassified Thermococcus]NJE07675.1 DUF2202 domain-containing protein [Thermococcus sp. M39]NJE12231.1 DUF2202 domain-containing protein [Thermococcus sp. LS2]
MKRVRRYLAFLLMVLIMSLAIGCTNKESPTSAATTTEKRTYILVKESGITLIDTSALRVAVMDMPKGEISEEEINGILYIREEEKLLRDTYLFLQSKWNNPLFSELFDATQSHMDAVLLLIQKYNLEDPATKTGAGEFINPEIQSLYNIIKEEGSKSDIDGLRAAAIAQEHVVFKLESLLLKTKSEDVELIYEVLAKASRNHLRVLVKALEEKGIEYKPRYLGDEEFKEIISSPIEKE